jgi:TolB protein
VSARDGNAEVYAMDTDGGNPRRLTRNPGDDWNPSWSPDGEHIAFASERGANFDIYVMDADGNNPQRLTKNPSSDWNPSWSPDGEHIAFTSNRDGNNDIYVMNANGKIPQNLTGKFFEQDVSPAWFRPLLAVAPAGKKPMMWGWLKQVVR